MADEGQWAQAEKAKVEGNNFFQAGSFAKALAAYARAIDLSVPEDDLDSLDGTVNPNLQVAS
eukprot:544514-Amphidinium_carterae.2